LTRIVLLVNMTRVVSRATCCGVEPGQRLRQAREAAGLSRAVLAQRANLSVSGVGALENGQNNIRPEVAERLAPIVGKRPEWLLYGRGEENLERRRKVPVVGYVSAGAQAILFAEGQGPFNEVDAPEGSTDATVAVEIRGESLGPLFDEWLVYYDDVRRPVTSDLVGELCVIGLPDGRILVKKLQRARGGSGLYHLLSNTEAPLLDQEVAWAAKVKTMTPR
jgi:transcriptional regulator with XRE-family HTH domain